MKKKAKQESVPWVLRICTGLLLVLILLLGSALAVYQSMDLSLYQVTGVSMLPTTKEGDVALINPKRTIERFDIVIFTDGDKTYIKRAIGLPGDTVVIENGNLSVNGVPYDEPYVAKENRQMFAEQSLKVNVPKDSYFMMGDNRDHSLDSREAGVVAKEGIYGVVSYLYKTK